MKPLLSRTPARLPLLLLLLALGAALRLVNLNAPPLDFHSTRQLRNSLVARAIYYDLLPNPDPEKRALAQSFQRAVGQYEPAIIESIAGWTYTWTGGESFAVPRIYQTFFWLLAGLALFDLARRVMSPTAARLSLSYYLVLPFSVQASRSFQPDPLMTSAFVIGLYFLHRWMEEQTWKWALLAGLFGGFAVLVKIVIAFLLGGAAVAAVLCTHGRRFWRSAQTWTIAGLLILPAFGYYVLGRPGRSTEYFFSWTVALVKLITSPHFYADWLGFVSSLLGFAVLFLSLVGTVLLPSRVRWMWIGLWAGYLLYGLTLPFQMFTHSYYHLQLVPVVALGLAPVAEALAARASGLSRGWKTVLIALAIIVIGYQSWAARSALVAEDYTHEPAVWEAIGKTIPARAEVIALTQDYGYDLMYWGWRKVDLWPLSTNLAGVRNSGRDLTGQFTDLTAGRDYFLVTASGQLDKQPDLKNILDRYEIAAQGEGFILYDLRHLK